MRSPRSLTPLRPGLADDVQRRPVPRRGWKWWTCGNGGNTDFHEAAESHFQPICWRWEKSRETAISRFPRPFPPTWRQARPVERRGSSFPAESVARLLAGLADRDHAGKQRTLRPFPAPAQGADSGRSAHYDPHSQRGEDASLGLTHYRAPNNPLTGQDA